MKKRSPNKELLQRYETALDQGTLSKESFSEQDFESLIDYFLGTYYDSSLFRAAEWALRIYPESFSLMLKYADILIMKNEMDKAIDLLENNSISEKDDQDVLMLRAKAYLKKGNSSKAVEIYNHLIELSEFKDQKLLEVIIGDCIENERYNEAIYFINKVSMDEMSLSMLSDLSFCYDQIENYKMSIQAADVYLDRDPFNAEVWFYLGITYHKVGNFDKAIEAYDYALALVKGNLSYKFHKALAYWAKKDYHKAEQLFIEYLDTNRDNLYGLLGLADCYLHQSEFDKAYDKFNEILKLSPTFKEAEIGAICAQLLKKYHSGDESGFYTLLKEYKLKNKLFTDIISELFPKLDLKITINQFIENISNHK